MTHLTCDLMAYDLPTNLHLIHPVIRIIPVRISKILLHTRRRSIQALHISRPKFRCTPHQYLISRLKRSIHLSLVLKINMYPHLLPSTFSAHPWRCRLQPNTALIRIKTHGRQLNIRLWEILETIRPPPGKQRRRGYHLMRLHGSSFTPMWRTCYIPTKMVLSNSLHNILKVGLPLGWVLLRYHLLIPNTGHDIAWKYILVVFH
jgi:hypothetical protein